MKLHLGYADGLRRGLGIVVIAAVVDDPASEFTEVLERDAKGFRMPYPLPQTLSRRHRRRKPHHINGGAWELSDHFTGGTVYDDRPLAVPHSPESRDYRLCWCGKDEPDGDWSAVVAVLVGD